MISDIKVSTNIPDVSQAIQFLYSSQLPFATKNAINNTLKQAQTAERELLGGRFTLRRKSWAEKNVKIGPQDFATKQKLEGIVRMEAPGDASRTDILAKFEAGGTKTGLGGGRVAIPREVRRSLRSLVPDGLHIKDLALHPTTTHTGKTRIIGKQRSFMVKSADGGVYILQRAGGSKRGVKRRIKGGPKLVSLNTTAGPTSFEARRKTGIRVLYVLKRGVQIDSRLHFVDTARLIVEDRFAANFAEAWKQALRSAR